MASRLLIGLGYYRRRRSDGRRNKEGGYSDMVVRSFMIHVLEVGIEVGFRKSHILTYACVEVGWSIVMKEAVMAWSEIGLLG